MQHKKTVIIAEAGVNHNGDMALAKELIDAAKESGADYVKFQSFNAKRLASKIAPMAAYQEKNLKVKDSQLKMLQQLELSYEDHQELIAYCQNKGIEFLSTPFDPISLDMLIHDFGLNTIKLGSSELTNAPILLHAARKKLPLILSTGMGNLSDIEAALGVIAFGLNESKYDCGPSQNAFMAAYEDPENHALLQHYTTLLHCTTQYPTPYQEVNLKVIDNLKRVFPAQVGYSDHTMGIEVSLAAVACGASVIEKHFTLDRTMKGPDHIASLEPNELSQLVKGIRAIEMALGNGIKTAQQSERENMNIARKSIVAARDIKKGELFTEENLTIKRPGNGLSPFKLWDLLGKESTVDWPEDSIIED